MMGAENSLIWVLLACNLLAATGVVLAFCVSRRGVEVNHLLLFAFGFLFYWILPIAVGSARLFEEMPGMGLWYELLDDVAESTVLAFLALSLFCLFAFTLGSVGSEYLFSRGSVANKIIYFHRSLLNLYLIPLAVVAALLMFALRDYIGRGYVGIVYEEVALRGSLISISLFLLVLALLYGNNLERKNVSFRQILTNRFFAIYFVVATAILLMGGRLYFLSSILMLLVYRSVYLAKIGHRAFLSLIAIITVISGTVGILRVGARVNPSILLLNVGAEPLFTSFSLVEFLRTSQFELVNAPIFLLSSFSNLLPTVLFPWKQELILDPSDYGYTFFAPFGALNSFVSFMVNFGVIGTILALFGFGAFLGYLKANRGSTLCKIQYIMISGWLAFAFFRDPFSVSIVKVIFQFSILTPVLVVLSLHILSMVARVGSGRHGTYLFNGATR